MTNVPEPEAFPPVDPPSSVGHSSGNRRDRYGNFTMSSRAKPKPVPERRPNHHVRPLYTTRVGIRGVQATCSCGYIDRMWHEHHGGPMFGLERAAIDGDRHARGLR